MSGCYKVVDGKLYEKVCGQWWLISKQAVSAPGDSAPPDDDFEIPPDDPANETPQTNVKRCSKVTGAVDYLFTFYESVMAWSQVPLPSAGYPGWLLSGLNAGYFDTNSLTSVGVFMTKIGDMGSNVARWAGEKARMKAEAICTLSEQVDNVTELTDADIIKLKAYEWNSGSATFDAGLTAFATCLESKRMKTLAYAATAAGTCGCVKITDPNPEPENPLSKPPTAGSQKFWAEIINSFEAGNDVPGNMTPKMGTLSDVGIANPTLLSAENPYGAVEYRLGLLLHMPYSDFGWQLIYNESWNSTSDHWTRRGDADNNNGWSISDVTRPGGNPGSGNSTSTFEVNGDMAVLMFMVGAPQGTTPRLTVKNIKLISSNGEEWALGETRPAT